MTKTIAVARSADETYDFLANPETMPQWAIHNVRAIRKLEGNRWEMETVRGKGVLIPRYEKAGRILDHSYIDSGEGVWEVTGRVVAVGPEESVYMITLPKPEGLPQDQFEAGMRLMDEELAALKACVEALPRVGPKPAALVATLYDAFRRRDLTKILSLLSPEVEIAQSTELPWGGVYRGHAGAQEFFGKLTSRLHSAVTVERMVESGDHVSVIGWTEGSVIATGATFRVPIVHVWRVVDGLMASVQYFIENQRMLDALGPG